MTSAHTTHPGLVRQNNEDSIYTDDTRGIFLLADGMGGHNVGEVANALAVDIVSRGLKQSIATTPDDGLFDLMVNAMQAAHGEINQKARTGLTCLNIWKLSVDSEVIVVDRTMPGVSNCRVTY